MIFSPIQCAVVSFLHASHDRLFGQHFDIIPSIVMDGRQWDILFAFIRKIVALLKELLDTPVNSNSIYSDDCLLEEQL